MRDLGLNYCILKRTMEIYYVRNKMTTNSNNILISFHPMTYSHGVIVSSFSLSLSLSLSESLLFLSDQDKNEQENIQNRLVKKSYKLREDSDQTVRMRMLI